jgi:hypothetical protein
MADGNGPVLEQETLRIDAEYFVVGTGFGEAALEQQRQERDVRIDDVDVDSATA